MKRIAILMLVCGCVTHPTPAPAPVPAGACQAAQERLEELGCQEAKTPKGTPFSEACDRAVDDGRSWCPVAVSRIDECAEFTDAAEGRRGDC